MKWDMLTSPELDAMDRSTPVILPISATEQHGKHLPLATDRLIGEHFLQALDQEITEKMLILPSIGVGYSAHHLDFAGTLSVSHDTFISQASDIIDCVIGHGFYNIIIFNSHGGNQGVGTVLLEKIGHAYPKCQIVLATWWKLAHQELLKLNESGKGGTGHAGEFETSLLQYFAPEMVREQVLEDGAHIASYQWNEGDMLHGTQASLYRSLKQTTVNGVFGRATAAYADKGQAITKLITAQLKKIIEDLKQNEK